MPAAILNVPPLDRTAGRSIFGLDAVGYHAGRIGYPDELYDRVLAGVGARPRVLEIGSGTGLVTEALLARDVASVTAVEPSAALVSFVRERLPDKRLELVSAAFPEGEVDGPFDLAVCAAAFHWMDATAALTRAKALLRPGGRWAMWWHSYRNYGVGDALADAITPLLDGIALPPSDSLHKHYSLDVDRQLETLSKAGFEDLEHHVFRRERTLTSAQVRALFDSYSYIRALPAGRRAKLQDAITELVEGRFSGHAPNVVLTPLYIGNAPE